MLNQLSLTNRRVIIFSLVTFVLLLSAARLGSAVAYRDYNAIFFIGVPFLMLIVLESNVIPIIIILLMIPFTDWAIELGMLPPQIMWAPELLSALIFVKALVNRITVGERINLFGIWIVVPFLGITFLSLLYNYNETSIISALLFLRLLFRYYLLFLAIINLDNDEKEMKIVNNVLVFIFISQLPISVVKLFLYGQGETSLGLSSHALPTSIPLIAIGFILSYHFLYRRSILNIILLLAFVGFSVVGKKRAFIFFLPVVLAYLGWYLRNEFENMLRYVVLGILVLAISSYFAFRLIPTLNPQRKVWGKVEPTYIISYVRDYTTSVTKEGMAQGRLSATISIFKQLRSRGLPGLLLGRGPGSVMKSRFQIADSRRRGVTSGIRYGMTGLNWLAMHVGYPGALTYLLLFYLILRKSVCCLKRELESYWRSFGLGMIIFSFVMLMLSLFYIDPFRNDALSAFYFCLAGFIVKRAETCNKEQRIDWLFTW